MPVMKLLFSILFENTNMLLVLLSMRNGKSLELGRKLFSCLVTHRKILKFFSYLQCNKTQNISALLMRKSRVIFAPEGPMMGIPGTFLTYSNVDSRDQTYSSLSLCYTYILHMTKSFTFPSGF